MERDNMNPPNPSLPQQEFMLVDEESLLLFASPKKKAFYHTEDSNSTAPTGIESESASSLVEDDDDDEEVVDLSWGWRLWQAYYMALTEHPLIVKSLTAFVLLGLADIIAQTIEIVREIHHDPYSLNWFRVARFGLFGLAGAPWTHYYYAWLDTVLPPTQRPWTWTTFFKVIIDQFLQAPALLAIMIVGMALMEGRGIDGLVQDMTNEYMRALIKNWELWIPATVVNIAFVTPDLRVLYDNLVFFFWTIFLSMLLNQPVNP